MDQVPYPGPPTLFHVRLNALFLILWLIDLAMLGFAIESTLTSGVGGAVLFANEVGHPYSLACIILTPSSSVRNLDRPCLEFNGQICTLCLRAKARTDTRRS